jgi:hypothetical protein
MRLKLMLVTAAAALCAAAAANCDAGGGSQFDDDGGPGSGSGGANSGGGFNPTDSGGSGSVCDDPGCIGSTPQGGCDGPLQLSSADAMDGARAIGLCAVSDGTSWGVVSADWVRSDGLPLTGGDGGPVLSGTQLDTGKGILSNFGNSVTPREGSQMLAISSGSARNPGEAGYQQPGEPPPFTIPYGNWKDSVAHAPPTGYPKESPSCSGQMVTTGEPYDSAGLRLTIKTPKDARSFKFDFNFYTYEYPDYICTQFNDFFVALIDPVPEGLMDGNISFDEQGNNISVNAGFLQVCNACSVNGKTFDCPLGYGEIAGTGFETNTNTDECGIQGSAATSWLVTTAPIDNPGEEITLHFAVWDSADGWLDSTVLIDNLSFEVEEGEVGTIPLPQ